ncbi:MAG TPA: Lrp/AsnC family transcriptional regulator [Candidatus Acidoferrales bacterium]|nr:Lrp/AsnC family transcriptional regulator [Candidatus Acidoferrales bacterium]
MDKLDYLILSELLKDAEASFVDVAKKVNSTPYTVRRRYEKMKADGTIFGCIASIDLSKLGYQGKATLLITLVPNSNRKETIEYVRNIRNVMVVTETMGPFDIMAIAPVTDLKSIRALVAEARKAPRVQRVKLACNSDVSFPIGVNFSEVLSKKSESLANATKNASE